MTLYPALFSTSDLDGQNGFALLGSGTLVVAGTSVSMGDLNGDGFSDIVIGAPANLGLVPDGSVVAYYGKASGFGPSVDLGALGPSDGFRITSTSAYFGWSVSASGDVNGDGRADLVTGSDFDGTVDVLYGGGSIPADLAPSDLQGSRGAIIHGPSGVDLGASIVTADVTGDGVADILAGADDASPGALHLAGSAWLAPGALGGFQDGATLQALAGSGGLQLDGQSPLEQLAVSASAGDVNGDGIADIVWGGFGAGAHGVSGAGAVDVVFGSASGFASASSEAALNGTNGFRILGEEHNGELGYSVSAAGDVNGDGYADILVGAPNFGFYGPPAAYLIFGKAGGFPAEIDVSSLDGSNGVKLTAGSSDGLGSSSSFGDVNGDGYDDLIVGAQGAYSYGGAVFVLFGKPGGWSASVDLLSLNGSDGFQFKGVGNGALGRSAATGDLNGDGLADILVGAPWVNDNSGGAYLLFGRLPDSSVDRTGTSASQHLVGGNQDDVLSGLAGQDHLFGHGGNDVLDGGSGDDTLDGGSGSDTASYADAGSAVGVDLGIQGVAQNTGGAGSDTLVSIENLTGSAFNDSLTGDGNDNVLHGGDGGDTLQGGPGADQLFGDNNNDVLIGGAGNDSLDGGAGSDTASYTDAPSAVAVDLNDQGVSQNTSGAGSDTLTSIENLTGSAFNDSLTGDANANVLHGGDGGDTLRGGAGADQLYGDNSDDVLIGGAGNDSLDGGAGHDYVVYTDAPSAVAVDLAAGYASGGDGVDALTSIEGVYGTAFNDNLQGDANRNDIHGGDGGDTIVGNAGDDVLYGEGGDDVLLGGPGDDILDGGAGRNYTSYSDAPSAVAIDLNITDSYQGTGGAGSDWLINIQDVFGSAFNDTIVGDNSNNHLFGWTGGDTLNGGGGADDITGGAGADVLIGGAGSDTFYYDALSDSTVAAPDLITDFSPGDRIYLAGIDADSVSPGDQAFHIGATPGHTGDLVVSYDNGSNQTTLWLYTDSDSTPDARITLLGDHSGLSSTDVVL